MWIEAPRVSPAASRLGMERGQTREGCPPGGAVLEDWLGAEMETNSSSLASHLLAWLEEWLEAQRLWLSLHPLYSRARISANGYRLL